MFASFNHCNECQGTTSRTTAAYRAQASVWIPLIEVEALGVTARYIQAYTETGPTLFLSMSFLIHCSLPSCHVTQII